ncbi:hypothetical protein [Streptomyces decoyicus]
MAKLSNSTVGIEVSFAELDVIKKSVEKAYQSDLLSIEEDEVARQILKDFGMRD